ncbi:MAG: aldo/keto reductase [Anaerolineales bacterium]|jgi:voltage-dependent potassium channel beta subunit
MNYRRLGRSGLKVSELSLGSWVTYGGQVDEDTSLRCIRQAFDLGVNYFDCADMYAEGKAEQVLGKAIRGVPRNELVISTKLFWPAMKGPNGRGLSRKHIIESIEGSLRRLGLDHVDLYFCHRFDPEVPLEETVRTMSQLVDQGKVLYWGTSEWHADQIASAFDAAHELHCQPPSMEQPQYNLFRRRRVEYELARLAERYGIGLTTFSPLAFGVLTGKYGEGIPAGSRATVPGYEWMREESLSPGRIEKARRFTQLAMELGLPPAQLAIAWCLRSPLVSSVITGASRIEQVRENLGAAEVQSQLTPEVLARLDEIFAPPQREEA